jgi:hypothetical protein
MDRRDFVKSTVVSAVALSLRAQTLEKFTLGNEYVEWEFSRGGRGLATAAIRNKLSGVRHAVKQSRELRLIFSAAKARVEIPWWRCTFGPDNDATPAAEEKGYRQGHHQREFEDKSWATSANLCLLQCGGGVLPRIQGRPALVFRGYGWFRTRFELPAAAQGEEVFVNLGGYDQTDWEEYWVFVNGVEVGRRSGSGRWRTPGQFRLAPGSAAHATLRFGTSGDNVLAVRTHGYDRHFGDWSDDVLDRHVVEPVMCEQFVTVGAPYLEVSDFEVGNIQKLPGQGTDAFAAELVNRQAGISVRLVYELDRAVRRKWAEVRNDGRDKKLLLDVHLDDWTMDAPSANGGYGYPLTVGDEMFCAVEHPSGWNSGEGGHVTLTHFPGRWLQPGETWRSHGAIAGVTTAAGAHRGFLDYLEANMVRKKEIQAIYDPFGITAFTEGMSWSLNEDQNLGVLRQLEQFQKKGVKFDYYLPDMSLDTTSDLKQFRLFSFPDGPARMIARIKELGMKWGQWFSVIGGNWSNDRYPKVAVSRIPSPSRTSHHLFRHGFLAGGAKNLCVASEPYFTILKDAILHHVTTNQVALIKLDNSSYYCNSTQHEHLPGKYSTEEHFNRLVRIARAARDANPNLFLIWYWGAYSPFFALHGDVIFDIRLSMEACSTGDYPALFFRDAVTQALDQGTHHAKWVPRMCHDSLGVWLANNWWGNYMETERWQEALIMDLARGNLLFPQIWSDLYNLEEHDIDWLARIQRVVKENESVFRKRCNPLGDPWKDEVYGYSFFDGGHGFVFLNNMSFEARKYKLSLERQQPVRLRLHHPVEAMLTPAGGPVEIELMPFEVMMIEVGGAAEAGLASRALTLPPVFSYHVPVRPMPYREDLEVHFADAAKLVEMGMKNRVATFEAQLPEYPEERYWIAIVNRLRKGGRPWRQNQMSQFVQAIATVDGSVVEFTRTPDFRQVSNNQWNPWIVFSAPLPKKFAGRPVQFGISSYVPEGTEMSTDLWVIKEWWKPRMRPLPNYWV